MGRYIAERAVAGAAAVLITGCLVLLLFRF